MARNTQAAAGQNAKTGQGLSTTYGGQAASTSNILTPTLNQLATAAPGFGKQTINNMNTAALQTAGGAAAGTVGQGNLQAARTNNAGGFAPAAAQAGHDATNALTDAALGVQNQDAQLKQQQQQEGIQGLEGQYATNVGAGENALGLSTNAINAKTQAGQSGWLQNVTGVLGTLASPFKVTRQI